MRNRLRARDQEARVFSIEIYFQRSTPPLQVQSGGSHFVVFLKRQLVNVELPDKLFKYSKLKVHVLLKRSSIRGGSLVACSISLQPSDVREVATRWVRIRK
jgi:hypothetical protein